MEKKHFLKASHTFWMGALVGAIVTSIVAAAYYTSDSYKTSIINKMQIEHETSN